jgi:hypothetical protein
MACGKIGGRGDLWQGSSEQRAARCSTYVANASWRLHAGNSIPYAPPGFPTVQAGAVPLPPDLDALIVAVSQLLHKHAHLHL